MTASGSEQARLLAEALREVPKELRPRVRTALKGSGEGIRQRAAENASWSRRIPRALRVSTRFGSSRPGVYIVGSRRIAPHARAYEGITGNYQFRHPGPGNDRDHWYPQDTRSFLAPAVAERDGQVVDAVKQALDDALGASGLL